MFFKCFSSSVCSLQMENVLEIHQGCNFGSMSVCHCNLEFSSVWSLNWELLMPFCSSCPAQIINTVVLRMVMGCSFRKFHLWPPWCCLWYLESILITRHDLSKFKSLETLHKWPSRSCEKKLNLDQSFPNFISIVSGISSGIWGHLWY